MLIDFNNELIKKHVEFLMSEEDASQLDAEIAKALFYLISLPEEKSKERIFCYFNVISQILGLPNLTWKEGEEKRVILVDLRGFQFKEGKITEKILNDITTMLSSKESIFRAYATTEKVNRKTVYDFNAGFLTIEATEYGQDAILRLQKIPDEFIRALVRKIAVEHSADTQTIERISNCIISRKTFENTGLSSDERVNDYLKALERKKKKTDFSTYNDSLKEKNLVDSTVFSTIYSDIESWLNKLQNYNPGNKTKFKESKQIVRHILFRFISKPKEDKKIELKAKIVAVISEYLQNPTSGNLERCFNRVNEVSQGMGELHFLANKEGEFRTLLKELLTAFESHSQITSINAPMSLRK